MNISFVFGIMYSFELLLQTDVETIFTPKLQVHFTINNKVTASKTLNKK